MNQKTCIDLTLLVAECIDRIYAADTPCRDIDADEDRDEHDGIYYSGYNQEMFVEGVYPQCHITLKFSRILAVYI